MGGREGGKEVYLQSRLLQGALNSRIVASKQKFQAQRQQEGGREYRTTSICDLLRLLRNILMHHTPGVCVCVQSLCVYVGVYGCVHGVCIYVYVVIVVQLQTPVTEE